MSATSLDDDELVDDMARRDQPINRLCYFHKFSRCFLIPGLYGFSGYK